MKKVSVCTMLMCFLAGTTHFPCYAGIFSSKEDKDKSKGPTVKQKEQQKAAADLNAPNDFDAFAAKSGQAESFDPMIVERPTAQQIGAYVQQVVGGQLPPGVQIHIHMSPQADTPAAVVHSDVLPLGNRPVLTQLAEKTPEVSSVIPPVKEQSPSPQADVPAAVVHSDVPPLGNRPVLTQPEQEKTPEASPVIPPVKDQSPSHKADVLAAVVPSDVPPSGNRPVLTQPEEKTPEASSVIPPVKDPSFQVVVENNGFVLSLPMSLNIQQKERYQLALIPNICAIYIYDALSKANHPSFLELNKQASEKDLAKIDTGIKWLAHYLRHYGVKHLKFENAMQLSQSLESTIRSLDLALTNIKFGNDRNNNKMMFSIECIGGPVIFAKIPGQDQ